MMGVARDTLLIVTTRLVRVVYASTFVGAWIARTSRAMTEELNAMPEQQNYAAGRTQP